MIFITSLRLNRSIFPFELNCKLDRLKRNNLSLIRTNRDHFHHPYRIDDISSKIQSSDNKIKYDPKVFILSENSKNQG
jgi:hypothetical protein